MTREHALKCWPEYYDAIERGEKPFEYRLNDRGYQVGDVLHLHRYDPDTPSGPQYTGQSMRRRVTYLLDRSTTTFPVAEGYCILGLDRSSQADADEVPEWIDTLLISARDHVRRCDSNATDRALIHLADAFDRTRRELEEAKKNSQWKMVTAVMDTNDKLTARVAAMQPALQKIAALREAEDATEPFDEALDLADAALAALPPAPREGQSR